MAFAYLPKHSKTWRVGYYDPKTGTKKTTSAKTRDPVKAKKFARDFEVRLRLKKYESNFETPQQNRTKLTDAYKIYKAQKEFSPETIRSFDSIVNVFTELTGDKYLFQYSKYDWFDFINALTKRNVGVNTRAIYSRHLFALFNWLIKENFVAANPVTKTKSQLKEVKPIPPDDLNSIMEYLKNKDDKYSHHYRLIKLTYLCAFRISEAIRSQVDDYDFNNRIITVRNHKGKRQDKIPMVNDIFEFIRNEFPLGKSGRLFDYASRESIKSFWNKMNEDLTFNYTVHQLRKTRGTELANAGVEPLFLQKFMRHKEFRTTQSYYIKIDMNRMAADINSKLNLNHNLNHISDRDKPRPAKQTNQLASKPLKLVKF